ncbi:Cof-type HAD-IIB family hydrolase [Brasilonema octagenarum UFV-E1]|uniref:Cof-type HAD-IIB family hydrolase n=2 Tax=Brasilonema TaxID=383614 RepID=A0A856MGZ0_9CYAN|nr:MULTISPECIES: Cof-type HAD-IIB family hydrolase [Brasilonema]NMF65186.1 Cof-type HAD-IIB family hydrolase [Brasilonema octagenarum UFV-OR1]QDL08216.1 Cof-type HAD-IIB family hydrolase [Brasilonema sennae CENA114]QDL14572.1 Cof-type HAD-IIB family hydrolase [Brasilonema octagenarum UFV-E1]
MHKVSATELASPAIGDTSTFDIQLLVVDIDGTIAGKSNSISTAVKQAIVAAQARGIQVAIATGRMYRSALRFHQEIGSSLPLLAYQGAWIQDPATQKIHRHLPVSRELAHKLLDYFEQPELRTLLSVHFYINDQLYVREITRETELYAERSGINPIAVGDLRQVTSNEPTKILALCDDTNIIQQLLGNLRSQYTPAELYLTTSVATFFEATNPFVNKGTGVRYLAEELLGLERINVMTIGDNFNDVEMLEYAAIGVAMGNAPAAVQAKAQWVAPDVECDGVAAAIERFLLCKK